MLPVTGLRSDGGGLENSVAAAGAAMTPGAGPGTFEEFWSFYLSEHGRPGTRAQHFAGTSLGLLFLAAAVLLRRPFLLIWGLAGAYALSWAGGPRPSATRSGRSGAISVCTG